MNNFQVNDHERGTKVKLRKPWKDLIVLSRREDTPRLKIFCQRSVSITDNIQIKTHTTTLYHEPYRRTSRFALDFRTSSWLTSVDFKAYFVDFVFFGLHFPICCLLNSVHYFNFLVMNIEVLWPRNEVRGVPCPNYQSNLVCLLRKSDSMPSSVSLLLALTKAIVCTIRKNGKVCNRQFSPESICSRHRLLKTLLEECRLHLFTMPSLLWEIVMILRLWRIVQSAPMCEKEENIHHLKVSIMHRIE